MQRRNLIIGAAASGIGGITLLGTGAFDTATAERTATVNFADDEDAYLGLVPESQYAVDDGGELALDFTGVSTDGEGIGRNSEYFFDLVFSIANQATNPVSITITTDTESFDGDFSLYPTGNRDEKLDDGSNAIELAVGESQSIGTHLKTGDVDVTNDVDIDIEIAGEFDEEGDEPEEPEPDPGPDPEPVTELEYFSTSSLLDGEFDPLDDDSVVAVRAEPTAENEGAEVEYPEDIDIPLTAIDEGVVAFGSELGPNESEEDDNRTFIVNTWIEAVGGDGTVKFDETHGQGFTLEDNYSQLETEAEDRGFDVEAIESDFVGALNGTDGVMIATDDDDVADFGGFSSDELDALDDFVVDGGAVFLHGTADFGGDSNDELNEVLDALDAPFRFNTDQVEDEENNGFAPFVPRTSNFNDEEFPQLFGEDE
ncbi:MAG: DUF1102 domain-containing protein [Halorubrum sp.]